MTDVNVVLKRFDNPDELREFDKGKFELVTLGGMNLSTRLEVVRRRWLCHERGLLPCWTCRDGSLRLGYGSHGKWGDRRDEAGRSVLRTALAPR